MQLGYRHARFLKPVLGREIYRGHEFHYSTIMKEDDAPLTHTQDAYGNEIASSGSYRDHVSGTYFHMIGEAG